MPPYPSQFSIVFFFYCLLALLLFFSTRSASVWRGELAFLKRKSQERIWRRKRKDALHAAIFLKSPLIEFTKHAITAGKADPHAFVEVFKRKLPYEHSPSSSSCKEAAYCFSGSSSIYRQVEARTHPRKSFLCCSSPSSKYRLLARMDASRENCAHFNLPSKTPQVRRCASRASERKKKIST